MKRDVKVVHLYEKQGELIRNSYPTLIEVAKLFETKEYLETEKAIIEALYKYQFLNMLNLEKYIKYSTKRQTPIDKNVEKMVKQGVIDYYAYNLNDIKGPALKLYTLSRAAYDYISESTSDKHYFFEHELTTEDILKTASVNQYHIGIITNNSVLNEKVNYRVTYREIGSVTIPSLITLKNKLNLIAIPMFRDVEDLGDYLNKLLKIAGYIEENYDDYRNYLFVYIASDNKSAIDGLNLLKNIKELKSIPFCYTIDYTTKSGNPLDYIMSIHKKEDYTSIHKLDFN